MPKPREAPTVSVSEPPHFFLPILLIGTRRPNIPGIAGGNPGAGPAIGLNPIPGNPGSRPLANTLSIFPATARCRTVFFAIAHTLTLRA